MNGKSEEEFKNGVNGKSEKRKEVKVRPTRKNAIQIHTPRIQPKSAGVEEQHFFPGSDKVAT
jgi:hypothetical protein